jgi:hypothetical protein
MSNLHVVELILRGAHHVTVDVVRTRWDAAFLSSLNMDSRHHRRPRTNQLIEQTTLEISIQQKLTRFLIIHRKPIESTASYPI